LYARMQSVTKVDVVQRLDRVVGPKNMACDG
jgi:hypothetical protein